MQPSGQMLVPVQAFSATLANGATASWTVPAGHDFIVTDIVGAIAAAGSTSGTVLLGADGPRIFYANVAEATSDGQQMASWHGSILVSSGTEIIGLVGGVPSMSLTVSGFLATPTSSSLVPGA